MSPCTQTLPPTDKGMWRRLLAAAHPDGGGSHELFVWTANLRDHVAGDAIEPPTTPRYTPAREDGADHVPFDPSLGYVEDFLDLTYRALSIGRRSGEPYETVLLLLADCGVADHGRRADRQMRGASYKQLAAIAYAVNMSKEERIRWYRVAEAIPLSMQHAHHILTRLNERR